MRQGLCPAVFIPWTPDIDRCTCRAQWEVRNETGTHHPESRGLWCRPLPHLRFPACCTRSTSARPPWASAHLPPSHAVAQGQPSGHSGHSTPGSKGQPQPLLMSTSLTQLWPRRAESCPPRASQGTAHGLRCGAHASEEAEGGCHTVAQTAPENRPQESRGLESQPGGPSSSQHQRPTQTPLLPPRLVSGGISPGPDVGSPTSDLLSAGRAPRRRLLLLCLAPTKLSPFP